jgi:hypothetical protein
MLINEQVLRLEITVNDIQVVQVLKGEDDLGSVES